MERTESKETRIWYGKKIERKERKEGTFSSQDRTKIVSKKPVCHHIDHRVERRVEVAWKFYCNAMEK